MTSASTSPLRMAAKVSSASASRRRRLSISASNSGSGVPRVIFQSLLSVLFTQIQPYQNALNIGKVADDLAHRQWQSPHQSGDGQNLIILGQSGILQQVNYLDAVVSFEAVLAEALQVVERCQRFGCLPCHVKPQRPLHVGIRRRYHCRIALGLGFHHSSPDLFVMVFLAFTASACRCFAICTRSSVSTVARSSSCATALSALICSISNSARSVAICASMASRLCSSSRFLPPASCSRTTAWACSCACWTRSALPVRRNPDGPRYTSRSSTP